MKLLIIITLVTILNGYNSSYLSSIYPRISRYRNRRHVGSSNPAKAKDYHLEYNEAECWLNGATGIRMIKSFRVDVERISKQCELLSLPILFFTEVKFENASSRHIGNFGYLNLLTEGPKSDEIFIEPMYNDNECMVIKK